MTTFETYKAWILRAGTERPEEVEVIDLGGERSDLLTVVGFDHPIYRGHLHSTREQAIRAEIRREEEYRKMGEARLERLRRLLDAEAAA